MRQPGDHGSFGGMRTTIVAYRTDMIGGRILNLMHGWRLARRLDADFIHLWPQFTKWRAQSGYTDPAPPLSQLFDLAEHALSRPDLRFANIEGLTTREAADFAQRRLRPLPALSDEPATYPHAPRAEDVHAHWPAAAFTATTPFPLAGDVREAVQAQATALIRGLPLNPALAAALRRVREAVDLATAITVNVRRGDIVSLIGGAAGLADEDVRKYADLFVSRYAPDKAFDDAATQWRDRPILVFSDSPSAAADCAARTPGGLDGRAFIAPIAAELTPLQAHMLQILTMSETDHILGSGSNFTIAAAAYGGGPYTDLRTRWTAPVVADTLDELFSDAPERIIAALFDAFDSYFAGQPQLAAERAALMERRPARLRACPA